MCLSLRHRWRAVRSRPAQEVNAGPPATQTWRRCACLTCSSAPLVPAVAGDRASGHALHRGHALALVEQLLKLNRGAGRITWGAPPRSAMRGQRALGGQRRVREQDDLPLGACYRRACRSPPHGGVVAAACGARSRPRPARRRRRRVDAKQPRRVGVSPRFWRRVVVCTRPAGRDSWSCVQVNVLKDVSHQERTPRTLDV